MLAGLATKAKLAAAGVVVAAGLAVQPAPAPHREVIWRPLPGSQTLALCAPVQHILYEGARGPGKTLCQLMRFLRLVGKGYGAYWRGIIFDLEFNNLSGLVTESKKWFPKLGGRFYESTSAYKWVWPTGEELLIRHVKKVSDYDGYHGHEYAFIGWNEITKHKNSKLYDKFMSVNRSTFNPERDTPKDSSGNYLTPNGRPLPPIPLEVFITANPGGPGHNWVKRRFITIAPRGQVVRTEVPIYNPATQQEEIVVKTQVTIFGSYRENPYLPPQYIADLESISDPNLREAWLYGNWDVTAGGALDDLWATRIHVVPRFIIPKSWRTDRTYDDGSTHPFSVGWWAEADGTEATIVLGDGTAYTFCPQPGSLIQFFEWYGTKEIGSNVGLKISSQAVALGIKQREIALLANGWIPSQPYAGPADNRIRAVTDVANDTPEQVMAKEGVRWELSDKSPGSRIAGLQLMRNRLQNSISGEGPAIYFMSNCVASIELLPALPRDEDKPDDVDTDAEDHPWDMTRYRLLKGAAKHSANASVLMPH